MRYVSVVRAVAGAFACGCVMALCQGCGSTPGSVGGAAGGAGAAGSTINLGLGGQSGARVRGSGGIVADAPSADVVAARKDARIEGAVPDVQEPPSTRVDGAQAVGRAATLPDVRPALDQAATPDLPAKESVVRDTPSVIDAGAHLDVGISDEPPARVDVPTEDGPALDTGAATGCGYGGVTYAAGDSFSKDCNACFCLAGGDVVCTVKVCPVDGGLAEPVPGAGKANAEPPRSGQAAWEASSSCDLRS